MRGAWPLVGPEVPECFPADAWAPLTRRHEEAQSCPRGSGRADGCRRAARGEGSCQCRARFATMTGMGVMVLGGFAAGECDVAKQGIVIGEAIHCDALGHRRLGNALGHAVSVGFVGALCADGREVRLAVGIVDRARRSPRWRARACVDAAGPGSRAAQPERPRPAGAYRRAAARRCAGRRSCRFWPCRHGWPAWRGHDRGHKGYRVQPEVSQPVPGQHACGSQDDLSAGGGRWP